MRRFERLLHKPVTVWEIEVEGAAVVTREGIAGGPLTAATQRFDSPTAAQQHADALIASWRADGYIPITRVAPAEKETPVHRDERRGWVDESSVSRFREIAQHDHDVRVVDGIVVGGFDQRQYPLIEKFKSIKEASARYDALVVALGKEIAAAEVAEKRTVTTKKQKRETKRVARMSRNSHPALEAECRAAGDEPGPWTVYADWLIGQNDPMGEVASLALGGDLHAAHVTLYAAFDELRSGDDRIEVELRHGFIHHITLHPERDSREDGDDEPGSHDLPALVRRVLGAPCCRFVDSIRFGLSTSSPNDNDWAPALAAICDLPHAGWLRALRFDDFTSDECELSWVPCGDLAFAWPKLPRLELLHIRAGQGGNLGTLNLPSLHTFIRETGGLARADLEAVRALDRPNLRHLELWTGTTAYGSEITLDDLASLCDRAPGLTHLGIVNSQLSDDLVPMLVASRYLPRLASLDLSKGIFARTATDRLVASAKHFRHLASLDLSENVLHDDEIAELRAVLDNVITDAQRPNDREDDFPGDPGERWIAVGE